MFDDVPIEKIGELHEILNLKYVNCNFRMYMGAKTYDVCTEKSYKRYWDSSVFDRINEHFLFDEFRIRGNGSGIQPEVISNSIIIKASDCCIYHPSSIYDEIEKENGEYLNFERDNLSLTMTVINPDHYIDLNIHPHNNGFSISIVKNKL